MPGPQPFLIARKRQLLDDGRSERSPREPEQRIGWETSRQERLAITTVVQELGSALKQHQHVTHATDPDPLEHGPARSSEAASRQARLKAERHPHQPHLSRACNAATLCGPSYDRSAWTICSSHAAGRIEPGAPTRRETALRRNSIQAPADRGLQPLLPEADCPTGPGPGRRDGLSRFMPRASAATTATHERAAEP